jgi:uncharacterized protein (DUF362 family)
MCSSDVSIAYNSKISYEIDDVRKMVSDALHLLKLDEENYGTSDWNPLGKYVHFGDKVLIKPNLVMHNNPSGEGTECLYTQPSVVEAVIEYTIKALMGRGSIIVGDAPMQGCHFDELISKSGYSEMISRVKKQLLESNQNITIELKDFRNTISNTKKGVVIEKEIGSDGITVNLANKSSFFGLSEDRIKNMRVTNYDPHILQEHHTVGKHEYLIARDALKADVVINMPKPKTHRKAGVTGALKNLVGMNSSKEYLPHHTRQTGKIKGDAFLHKNFFLRMADSFEDDKCVAEKCRRYKLALFYRYAGGACRHLGRKVSHEKYGEGSWYGNDTIWRTILDLNKILQYADKNGKICETRQRRFFNIGDMIISGEKDGPIRPSRKDVGIIIAGEDPCSFDEVTTALMGFETEKIPTIREMRKASPQLYLNADYKIKSNNNNWDGKSAEDICENFSLHFAPNPGWQEALD